MVLGPGFSEFDKKSSVAEKNGDPYMMVIREHDAPINDCALSITENVEYALSDAGAITNVFVQLGVIDLDAVIGLRHGGSWFKLETAFVFEERVIPDLLHGLEFGIDDHAAATDVDPTFPSSVFRALEAADTGCDSGF